MHINVIETQLKHTLRTWNNVMYISVIEKMVTCWNVIISLHSFSYSTFRHNEINKYHTLLEQLVFSAMFKRTQNLLGWIRAYRKNYTTNYLFHRAMSLWRLCDSKSVPRRRLSSIFQMELRNRCENVFWNHTICLLQNHISVPDMCMALAYILE